MLAATELARGDVVSAREEIERALRATPDDLRVVDAYATIALLDGDAAAVLRVAAPHVGRLSRDAAAAVDAASVALAPWLDGRPRAATTVTHAVARAGLRANASVGAAPRPGIPATVAAELEQWFCALWSVPALDESPHARATFDWLMRAANDVGAGDVVLDAGAGQCRYAPFFAHACYLPVDFGKGDASWNYRRLAAVADLAALPLARCSVHMVFNTSVMEHVRHPERVLAEYHRVLRWGGSLRMYVPFLYGIHQPPHDYFRFTRHAWEAVVADAGFRRVEVREASSDFYAGAHWFRSGLLRLVARLDTEMRAVVGLFLRDVLPALEAVDTPDGERPAFPIGYFVDAWKLP